MGRKIILRRDNKICITKQRLQKIIIANKNKTDYLMRNLPFDLTNYVLEFLKDKDGVSQEAKRHFKEFINLPMTCKTFNIRYFKMHDEDDQMKNEYEYAIRKCLVNNLYIDRAEQVTFNNYETDDGKPDDMTMSIYGDVNNYDYKRKERDVDFLDKYDIEEGCLEEEDMMKLNGIWWRDTYILHFRINKV